MRKKGRLTHLSIPTISLPAQFLQAQKTKQTFLSKIVHSVLNSPFSVLEKVLLGPPLFSPMVLRHSPSLYYKHAASTLKTFAQRRFMQIQRALVVLKQRILRVKAVVMVLWWIGRVLREGSQAANRVFRVLEAINFFKLAIQISFIYLIYYLFWALINAKIHRNWS